MAFTLIYLFYKISIVFSLPILKHLQLQYFWKWKFNKIFQNLLRKIIFTLQVDMSPDDYRTVFDRVDQIGSLIVGFSVIYQF